MRCHQLLFTINNMEKDKNYIFQKFIRSISSISRIKTIIYFNAKNFSILSELPLNTYIYP